MNKFNWNSRENLWRPKEKIKNRIRIMPWDSKGNWEMRVDIHVIDTRYQRYQRYICNRQLFNVSCKLCNMKKRLKRQDKPKEAEKIVLRRYTFLNIIDREREAEGVKVWMAPISAWSRISFHLFNEDSDVSFFDTPPNEERGWKCWSYGQDLNVIYDPEEEPIRMYSVQPLFFESTPLGTEEQREIWASQVLPLLPENYYDPVELKDKELKLLEKGIAELVSHEEFMAYIRTPEHEAELERRREEEKRKRVEEEQAKIERKKYFEEISEKMKEDIKTGQFDPYAFNREHGCDLIIEYDLEEWYSEWLSEQKKEN